mgnify:CR=1 FL=1
MGVVNLVQTIEQFTSVALIHVLMCNLIVFNAHTNYLHCCTCISMLTYGFLAAKYTSTCLCLYTLSLQQKTI